MFRAIGVSAALCFSAGAAGQGLTEDRVLLLWNSENAASGAVRDAYVAARPGVMEFDLDSAALGSAGVSRSQYNSLVRDPVLAFLSGTVGGEPLAERVIAIATTRGLPARVNGPGEFTFESERASLESELSLIHQDLDGVSSGLGAARTLPGHGGQPVPPVKLGDRRVRPIGDHERRGVQRGRVRARAGGVDRAVAHAGGDLPRDAARRGFGRGGRLDDGARGDAGARCAVGGPGGDDVRSPACVRSSTSSQPARGSSTTSGRRRSSRSRRTSRTRRS